MMPYPVRELLVQLLLNAGVVLGNFLQPMEIWVNDLCKFQAEALRACGSFPCFAFSVKNHQYSR